VEDQPIKVLLVDDDLGDIEMVRSMLAQAEHGQYRVDWVSSYEEALDAFRKNQHEIYLLDYFLEDRSGLDLLREAEAHGVTAPMIMLTGRGSSQVDLEAMEAGAADYLVKGAFDPNGLERAIRYALGRGAGAAATGKASAPGEPAVQGEAAGAVPDRELFGAEGRFRAVFHSTRSPVALVDLDGLLLEVNEAFAAMFFSSAEDAEGASYVELLERGDQAPVLRDLGALSREEVNQVSASRGFQTRDGAVVQAQTSMALIRDKEGQADHLVVVVEGVG
jgi:PAS domain S-box-containing protein